MRERVIRSTAACDEEAMLAQMRAIVIRDPALALEHRRLADSWRSLAATFREAERVSGYIEWRSRWLRD